MTARIFDPKFRYTPATAQSVTETWRKAGLLGLRFERVDFDKAQARIKYLRWEPARALEVKNATNT